MNKILIQITIYFWLIAYSHASNNWFTGLSGDGVEFGVIRKKVQYKASYSFYGNKHKVANNSMWHFRHTIGIWTMREAWQNDLYGLILGLSLWYKPFFLQEENEFSLYQEFEIAPLAYELKVMLSDKTTMFLGERLWIIAVNKNVEFVRTEIGGLNPKVGIRIRF